MEIAGQFAVAPSDSVVVLDAGATANLVRFKWLGNRNSFLQEMGSPKLIPNPTMARFKVGDGSAGEVRHAADIKVGIAGRKGAFTAFLLEADVPALL